jgi:hypothetical protein
VAAVGLERPTSGNLPRSPESFRKGFEIYSGRINGTQKK